MTFCDKLKKAIKLKKKPKCCNWTGEWENCCCSKDNNAEIWRSDWRECDVGSLNCKYDNRRAW